MNSSAFDDNITVIFVVQLLIINNTIMKKLYFIAAAVVTSGLLSAQTVIYSNTFESGVGDATIVGNGAIVDDASAGFGKVFHNAAGGQAIRANYLKLPETVFADLQASGQQALSIGFWVNKGTAVNNFWTPIFSAYGAAPVNNANTWPMMVLQSRLVAQVNVGGWTDLVDAQNVKGVNQASTAWLDDNGWHYYTAVFTATNVKVYVDGVIQNEWNLDGVTAGQVAAGLFTNGSELKYIALGGNQAWNWGDPDPAYKFDDVAVYASALSVEQINAIRTAKSLSTALPGELNDKVLVSEDYFNLNGTKVSGTPKWFEKGSYIHRAVFSDGSIKTVKVIR